MIENLKSQLSPLDFKKTYWVAYSGGLDSHVLLHSMAELRRRNPQLTLHALHVHHGLSPYADHWAEHGRLVCLALNIPFTCEYISDSPKSGESVEAWAREGRYRIFAKNLSEGEIILTAHNQDDQAETVLLQLMRGAGPKGLAAMPDRQVLGKGYLIRPFLKFSRRELQAYALHHSLDWIEDESNTDQRFDRNFLRRRVFPILKERWPEAAKSIFRSASHCAESSANLAELAQSDLGAELSTHLSLKKVRALSSRRQRNLLRYWLFNLGCQMPSAAQMQRIQHDLIAGRQDSQPLVCWGKWRLYRYRNELILEQIQHIDLPHVPIKWDLSIPLNLPGGLGQLCAQRNTPGELSLTVNPQELNIRFRQGGERCQPAGKKNTYSLKKLFQEWGVPPWRRGFIPLLFYQDELAAVIPYCICQPFAAQPGEEAWVISRVAPAD